MEMEKKNIQKDKEEIKMEETEDITENVVGIRKKEKDQKTGGNMASNENKSENEGKIQN